MLETCKMHNMYDNDSNAVYDGHGIILFYSCRKCHKEKLSKYRLDIFENYRPDEPLDED
jgi:hypothetical protein